MEKKPQPAEDTALGIDQHIEAVLCYLLSWISGIIFLFVEKRNRFVRFHALQSLLTFLGLWAVSVISTNIPYIGWIFKLVLYPVQILLWVFLMYKAFQNELYKLPIAGDIAFNQVYGRQSADKEQTDE